MELERRALEVVESWELYRDHASEDASDYDLMEEGVRQLKELLEAQHRWRSVDEYPTEVGLYIATDGDMVSAAYFGVGSSSGVPYWSSDGYLSEDITHWMPMPKPPMEDE